MIRHVVVWRLLGESVDQKRQRFDALAPELEALATSVPGVLSLSVNFSTGPNPNNWDMCLVSDHESWAALEVYANHPEHLAVAAKVTENVSERAGADFEA